MNHKKMQGVSLIEVLIAFAVVCIILLGVIKVSLSNIHIESAAMNQSIASMRINALFERLRVNWQTPASTNTINQWNQHNLAMLPLGHGTVNCNAATKTCTAQITWITSRKHAYAVTARVPHIIQLAPPKVLDIKEIQ